MEETGILENPALLTPVLPVFEPGQKKGRFSGRVITVTDLMNYVCVNIADEIAVSILPISVL
jgi:hypothetical protein